MYKSQELESGLHKPFEENLGKTLKYLSEEGTPKIISFL
jgi:hypothetical protein